MPADTAPWTISRVIAWTAKDLHGRGVESSRLDAELLIAHALKLRRLDLYLRFDQPLVDAELAAIRTLVERRRKLEPIAYILGARDFYGRSFAVDRRVLIPRPETEGVIEAALALLPPRAEGVTHRALDVCAGSGCIAITLACERPDVTVDAVELSAAAAEVARANAERLGVSDRVRVFEGSLYKPLEAGVRYAVITSNPPYIPTAEVDTLMPDVSEYEPRLALDGGEDGASVLRPLFAGARARLLDGAAIVVEIGYDQSALAQSIAREAGFTDVTVREDLAKIERVVVAR
jgi:release factor glutamine methyltransferase